MIMKDLAKDLGAAMRAAMDESPYDEKDLALKAGMTRNTMNKWLGGVIGQRYIIFLLCLDRMGLDPEAILPDEASRTMREARQAISKAVGDAIGGLSAREHMELVFGDLTTNQTVYSWRRGCNIDIYVKFIRALKLLDVSLMDVMDRDTMREQDEARRRLRKIRQGRAA